MRRKLPNSAISLWQHRPVTFCPPKPARGIHVRAQLAAVAEAYGFQPIETPMFEKVELFLARTGPEIKSSAEIEYHWQECKPYLKT